MSSIAAALDELDRAVETFTATDSAALPIRDHLTTLHRLETCMRRLRVRSCAIASTLDRSGDKGLGAATAKIIADVIRITPTEARRRIHEASQTSPRTTLTGQPLPPTLPATATAWNAGLLDPEHLRAIEKFHRQLPASTHPDTTHRAETFLAHHATELRPDQLHQLADKLAAAINPDGNFTDDYRAQQRSFTWCGPQRADGMSLGKLLATPQLRAEIDAWLAKFAAPGMCNPNDETPTTTGQPPQHQVDSDTRHHAQRQHDALSALLRGQLGNPALGQHNGLPVTVIVSTTLQELTAAAGQASTAAGTQLPIADLIRMAAHAHHYLCLFDNHTNRPLYLGRTKRIASPDQRVILHAKDRGCTAPGCTTPGYLCEVHHIDEWAYGGHTNIDRLTFACRPHHRLLTPGGWKTRKTPSGHTEWLPPPHIPLPPNTNTYHHPEQHLPDNPGGP